MIPSDLETSSRRNKADRAASYLGNRRIPTVGRAEPAPRLELQQSPRERVFDFPEHWKSAHLYVRHRGSDDRTVKTDEEQWTYWGPAQGTVRLSSGTVVKFVVTCASSEDLYPLLA